MFCFVFSAFLVTSVLATTDDHPVLLVPSIVLSYYYYSNFVLDVVTPWHVLLSASTAHSLLYVLAFRGEQDVCTFVL